MASVKWPFERNLNFGKAKTHYTHEIFESQFLIIL